MNESVSELLRGVVQERYKLDVVPELSRPEPEFGDLSTNIALQIAPKLKKAPKQIAEEIAKKMRENDDFMSIEVAGPGFLNIRFQDEILIEQLGKRSLSVNETEHGGRVVVIETNNPNPFKDLHIGHAYNSIIADTVANLLDASHSTVHRVSYHGDIGLHVGKSMWAILRYIDENREKLDTIAPLARPAFMSECYVEGSKAYKENPNYKAEIEKLAAESFTLADSLYRDVYETVKGWSFDYIDHIVKAIGSQEVEKRYLESQADQLGMETVKANIGEVFSESEEAVVFAGEAFGLHTRVFISRRGTGLYEARDLGLMQLKQQDFHPARSYIVTGNEQREYFKVVIKAAELCLPELDGVTHNLSTGTVKLSSGKMSSREGNVLNIEWLFEQLKSALKLRGGDKDHTQTLVGALRYTMLRVRVGGDVVFDIESALSLEGNSGPYLQYAHARACSILEKLEGETSIDQPLDDEERMMVLKLGEYHEVLLRSAEELLPHHLCTYLYELAQVFNRFYESSRILGDPRESVRAQIVREYVATLGAGLGVLGIPAPKHL